MRLTKSLKLNICTRNRSDYYHSTFADEDFCCGLQSPDMATNQNARRPHNRGWCTLTDFYIMIALSSDIFGLFFLL